MKDLSVIVPTKDRAGIIEESLSRLCKALEGLDAEVIVVNDSATTAVDIPSGYSNVRVFRNPGSGVASARNFGAGIAEAPLLFFMDDDMWLDTTAIARIRELGKLYPNDAVNLNWTYPEYLYQQIQYTSFGRYLIRYGFTSMKGWSNYPQWKDQSVFEVPGIAGACLVVAKEKYLGMGGYHSGFPMAGFEDYDFSQRLLKSGSKLYIDTTVLLYHNESNKATIEGWLRRYENASVTRRYAVEIGYTELALKYNAVRKLFYPIVYGLRSLFFRFLNLLPNQKMFDGVYKIAANFLLGAHIWKGYSQKPLNLNIGLNK